MTLLDRYIGRRFLSALVKSLVAFLALFVLIDLLTARRQEIMNYDVPAGVVLQYYAAYLPWITQQMAPLAVLVSGLLVLGAAAQNREVTAALAGGVSLWRFVRMPLVVSLLLALGLIAMNETFGARATATALAIDDRYFSKNPQRARQGVSWAHLSGKWSCHILKFNRVALTGEGVFLDSIRSDAVEQIRADRIYWDDARNEWVLEDGRWLVFGADVDTIRDDTRITQQPAPFTETPAQLFALEAPPDAKTARQMAAEIDQAIVHRMPVQRHWVDFYAKFSRPALAFVMIWLAIPFALRLRRGGVAIGFGLSIAIAILYLMLYATGMGLGYLGKLPPFMAAWLANLVFFGTGIVLFRSTPT
jgi:lipopolysaccharide export system permease protein